MFTNLPVTKELNKAILVYNDAFHAYNEVSMTDENLTVLKNCNAKMDSLGRFVYINFLPRSPRILETRP